MKSNFALMENMTSEEIDLLVLNILLESHLFQKNSVYLSLNDQLVILTAFDHCHNLFKMKNLELGMLKHS